MHAQAFGALNAINANSTARICSACRPGEAPLVKGSAVLPADQFAFTATGLEAGEAFAFRVSAQNSVGYGHAAAADCMPQGATYCDLSRNAALGDA